MVMDCSHAGRRTVSWVAILGTLVTFWSQSQQEQYYVSGFSTQRLQNLRHLRSFNVHSLPSRPYLPACSRSLGVPSHTRQRRLCTVILVKSNPSDEDGEGNDDVDFYRDLERAKIEKLGMNIPPEEARKSAIQSEQDFLAAMKEVSEEFQQAKNELGSDGAVDLFINRIQEEEEERNEQDRKRKDENSRKKRSDDDLDNAFQ